MSDIFYMTQESYDKLSNDLDILKSDGRAKAAAAIAEAREKGDLSENAEYDAAKDAQGMLEAKINAMEKSLANSRIIDESELDSSAVTVLSNVTMRNVKTNHEVTYKLVAPSEADFKANKISVKSPIGEGLLGKAVGEIAQIQVPSGVMEFEILNISF